MTRTPLLIYKTLLERGLLKPNLIQANAVEKLEKLHFQLQDYNPPEPYVSHEKTTFTKLDSPDFQWQSWSSPTNSNRSFFQSLFQRKTKSLLGPKGLYLFGGVGTGKSMLMDLFYESVPVERKRRVHFHAFMQDIHKRIHQLKEEGIAHDPLPIISASLAKDAWLLCFDELQVTNIVDAMLLRRLFTKLFDHGVVMVATSNRHPDGNCESTDIRLVPKWHSKTSIYSNNRKVERET
jgi:protein AFG1